jgi:predicted metalloprotease with PDZ domain
MIAANLADQLRRKGRRWRSLEDTSVANYILRAPSNYWSDLRRDQDFYFEGSLLWWEVDVKLRNLSKGKVSLDDFCKQFMGDLKREGKVVTYELGDIIRILNGLAEYEWEKFFVRRVSTPMETFPLEVVSEAGYRVGYGKSPSGFQDYADRTLGGDSINARDSLGMTLNNDGNITGLVLDSLADKKGLHDDIKIIGVNGKKFSRKALMDALEASVKTEKIELLILKGEDLITVLLPYKDGPRYFEIVRDENKPDRLGEILKPRVPPKEKK